MPFISPAMFEALEATFRNNKDHEWKILMHENNYYSCKRNFFYYSILSTPLGRKWSRTIKFHDKYLLINVGQNNKYKPRLTITSMSLIKFSRWFQFN
jgi:hypothetical protein